MMLVLLMRHGESVANFTHEESFDPSLTDLGASQASAWRECARTWDLVSPLLRCIQTAAHALGASRARWMYRA
jgi:broad specificity phosphatase PhoE